MVLKYSYKKKQEGGQVSKYDRIIRKLNNESGNLTFNELNSLLAHLGYEPDNKGRTSGSRIQFYKSNSQSITLHKPHPRKTLLNYQIKQITATLKKNGDL